MSGNRGDDYMQSMMEDQRGDRAEQPRDKVVEAVRADLLRRSQLGIQKYGMTLERTDLSLKQWLQHAYEETLDQANYLKRAILEIEKGPAPDDRRDWDEADRNEAERNKC